jgi:hypothetical protein
MNRVKTGWGEIASHICPVSCEQIHSDLRIFSSMNRPSVTYSALSDLGRESDGRCRTYSTEAVISPNKSYEGVGGVEKIKKP